ncbi:hypothetical protein [Catellatospora sichuanensis]|uniref:hypothetical protein n=1 Tax=Catellatospora sichuanensis TaxID=1969805 RepID=UPI0011822F16|nr:hypothetical protein [Catellatospora sichuanensis]
MSRFFRAVVTVIVLSLAVPILVLASAAAGLAPRHWSGIPLSGWEVPYLDAKPRQKPGTVRPPHLDSVADEVFSWRDSTLVAMAPLHDGSVYIQTTRLTPSLLAELGRRFDGDKVSVVYSPFYVLPSLAGGDGGGDRVRIGSRWERADPLGTWVTLMFGFPWQLGVALLLTAFVYVAVPRLRRRSRDTATAA